MFFNSSTQFESKKVHIYDWFNSFASIFFTFLNAFHRIQKLLKSEYKIGVLKNFSKFTEKYLCWSLFLISCRSQACNFIEKDYITSTFLWILWNFQNHLFYRTPLMAASLKSEQQTCSINKWNESL